jgi:hypothetical protein
MQQRLIILKQIYIFFSVIRSSADNVFRRLFIWIYALLNVISTMHRGYLTSLQTVRLQSHWSFFFFFFGCWKQSHWSCLREITSFPSMYATMCGIIVACLLSPL